MVELHALGQDLGFVGGHGRVQLAIEMCIRDSPVACLRTAGVPLAPLDDVMEVVGRALIELCDANMPLAAAPLASLVAST